MYSSSGTVAMNTPQILFGEKTQKWLRSA